jgi:hypothetical protein
MERSQVLDVMGQLKLYGMKAAYDEIVATAVRRQHEPQKIVGDLLSAEISEKQARSIKYQLTIAKLPLAKEIDEFDFAETPVNETLVRDLVGGNFLEQQRNVVLIHCPAGHCEAMSREGAARAPANPTSPSVSPGPASAAASGGASSTSSTS